MYVEDINKEYKKLMNICNKYGLEGMLYEYKPNSRNEDKGLYFVVSRFPEMFENLNNGSLNLDDILRKQGRNGILNTNIYAINLSERTLKANKAEIIRYCKFTELTVVSFKEYGYEVPPKISYTILEGIDYFNKQRYNSVENPFFRETAEEYYKNLIKDTNEKLNKDNFLMSMFSKKRKQKINDLKDFVESGSSIKFYRIDERSYPVFKEYIKQYPEVCYWAEKKPLVLDAGEFKQKKGMRNPFEGEERYDITRRIGIHEADEPILLRFVNEMQNERYNTTSLEEIKESTELIVVEIVHSDLMDTFDKLCKENNIKYAIDIREEFSKNELGYYTVVFDNKEKPKVDAILNGLLDNIVDEHMAYPAQRFNARKMEKEEREAKELKENKEKVKDLSLSL